MALMLNHVLALYENTSMDRSTWMSLKKLTLNLKIIPMVDAMTYDNSKQTITHDPKKINTHNNY